MDVRSKLANYCKQLATTAHLEYCKQITPVIYLYGFEEPNGSYSELVLSRLKPKYFTLVICTYVPRDKDIFGLTQWFVSKLTKEPILPAII